MKNLRLASLLAAKFAQEIGLPPGNMWEPPISRWIKNDLDQGVGFEYVEDYWRFRLNLES